MEAGPGLDALKEACGWGCGKVFMRFDRRYHCNSRVLNRILPRAAKSGPSVPCERRPRYVEAVPSFADPESAPTAIHGHVLPRLLPPAAALAALMSSTRAATLRSVVVTVPLFRAIL